MLRMKHNARALAHSFKFRSSSRTIICPSPRMELLTLKQMLHILIIRGVLLHPKVPYSSSNMLRLHFSRMPPVPPWLLTCCCSFTFTNVSFTLYSDLLKTIFPFNIHTYMSIYIIHYMPTSASILSFNSFLLAPLRYSIHSSPSTRTRCCCSYSPIIHSSQYVPVNFRSRQATLLQSSFFLHIRSKSFSL